MAQIEVAGRKIEVDSEGFLVNENDWDEAVACALAEREGIEELTKERMAIIKFMREFYKVNHAFPVLNGVCLRVNQPKSCVRKQFMDPLTAWKVAGLPKPDEHVVAELRGEGGVV